MNQLERKKKEMARKMLGVQQGNENRKYGELILQTNEVQFKLATVIILNSFCPDKKYCEELLGMTSSPLIALTQACVKLSINDLSMLREYFKARNKLSHKMYTSKRLTISECTKVLADGEKILALLNKLIKIKITKF
jgi:hypothetical protein